MNIVTQFLYQVIKPLSTHLPLWWSQCSLGREHPKSLQPRHLCEIISQVGWGAKHSVLLEQPRNMYFGIFHLKSRKKLPFLDAIRGPRFICKDIYLFFNHIFGFHTSSSTSITNSIDYSITAPPIPITGTSSRIIPAVNTCGAL